MTPARLTPAQIRALRDPNRCSTTDWQSLDDAFPRLLSWNWTPSETGRAGREGKHMSDFTQPLNADIADPSDVVLWLGNSFAGNVGHRVSDAGHIFDIDAALAVEIARRWNGFATLEAQVAAADRLAKIARSVDKYINWQIAEGLNYHPTLPSAADELRAALTAYHATKETTC